MFHFFKTLANTVANAKPNKLRLFADENELFKVKNSQGVVRTLGNAVRSFEYVSTNGLVDIYLVKTDDFEFDLPVTNGRGIESIDPPAGAGEPGALDEYTIVFNDGTQGMLLVRNGTNGKDGTGVPTMVVAQTIGDENTAGTPGPEYANIDHKHAHGEQTNPAHHAVATTGANGFMSKEDKEKLLGVATGATRVLVDASPADGSNNAVASNGVFDALALKLNAAEKGAANGVTPLGADQKVPAIFLPSYVDDVLEFANLAAFPNPGEKGKIYVAENAGTPADPTKIYRWSGSTYIESSPSPGSTDAVAEGSSNLYFTVQRVRDTLLTGLSLVAGTAITAADSVLSAFGKLQAQISAITAFLGGSDPFPQYTTSSEAAAAAPVQSVNGQTGAVVVASGANAVTNTTRSASFSTAVTTVGSFPIAGGSIAGGAQYRIKVAVLLTNTTAASNLVASFAVGATAVQTLTQALGATARTAQTVTLEGSITFSSATAADAHIRGFTSSAVAFDTLIGTGATPTTVATAANTDVNVKLNTSAATSTLIVKELTIEKVK